MPAIPLRDRLPGLGPLGFGGAPLGNLYAPIAEAEALGALRAALAAGVRLFDTAPHYGQGLSERRFGAVLRDAPRDSFVLMTKTGRLLEAEGSAEGTQDGFVGALGAAKRYDYSADGTLRSLADSRARLGLGRIDIALIHDIDVWTHGAAQPAMFAAAMEGAAPALTRLREAGEIAAWGLGVNEVAPCRAALDQADPDLFLLAGRYTLLDQAGLGLLDECARRGVGIVIGGPFNSGILATGPIEGARYDYKPATAEVLARSARIEAACARHGVALAAAALRFTLGHPAVLAAIPGARSPAEVAANMALARTPIPAALWRDLKRDGLLAEAAPEPPEQGA
jgi:D-threo-aldose 1-dehydrogenase